MKRFVDHNRQVVGDRSLSRDWQARARLWIDDDASKAKPGNSVIAAADRLAGRIGSFNNGPPEAHWNSVVSIFARTGRWTKHVDIFGPDPTSAAYPSTCSSSTGWPQRRAQHDPQRSRWCMQIILPDERTIEAQVE
jgi:hypothetical protein